MTKEHTNQCYPEVQVRFESEAIPLRLCTATLEALVAKFPPGELEKMLAMYRTVQHHHFECHWGKLTESPEKGRIITDPDPPLPEASQFQTCSKKQRKHKFFFHHQRKQFGRGCASA